MSITKAERIARAEIVEPFITRCAMLNCGDRQGFKGPSPADYFIPQKDSAKPHYYCQSCRDTFPEYTWPSFVPFYSLEWVALLDEVE